MARPKKFVSWNLYHRFRYLSRWGSRRDLEEIVLSLEEPEAIRLVEPGKSRTRRMCSADVGFSTHVSTDLERCVRKGGPDAHGRIGAEVEGGTYKLVERHECPAAGMSLYCRRSLKWTLPKTLFVLNAKMSPLTRARRWGGGGGATAEVDHNPWPGKLWRTTKGKPTIWENKKGPR